MAKRGFLCQHLPHWLLTCLALACLALNGWLLFPPSPLSIVPLSFTLCAVNLLAVKLITETDDDKELAHVAGFAGCGCTLGGIMAVVRVCTFALPTDQQRTAFAVITAFVIFICFTVAMCGGCNGEKKKREESEAAETVALSTAEEGTAAPTSTELGVLEGQQTEAEADAAEWAAGAQKRSTGAPPGYSAVPSEQD
ncbi:hypothetical protein JCM6882_001205 [Rhodosporidiobolus microsporus]